MGRLMGYLAEPRIALAMTVILGLIVAVLTLTPSQTLPSAPGGDKLHHFLAFGAIAFPMAFARPRLLVLIVLAVSVYGAVIEIIQSHVGRHGDIVDALANAIGAVTGATIGAVLRIAVRKRGADDTP
jgi:VanZ family protein